MKPTTKEITLSFSVIALLAIALFCFLSGIRREKNAADADLFGALPPECTALVYLPKTADLSGQVAADSLLSGLLPDACRFLLRHSPPHASFLIAVTPEGPLLYGRLSPADFSRIRKISVEKLAGGYAPQTEAYRENRIDYYPLGRAGYLGCFYRNGILVAGTGKKSLERAVGRTGSPAAADAAAALQEKINTRVAPRLLFKTEAFIPALFPPLRAGDPLHDWLEADLTFHGDEICGYGSIAATGLCSDSVRFRNWSDSLSVRFRELLPAWTVTVGLHLENEQIHYTVCGKLSVPTVSPSYE